MESKGGVIMFTGQFKHTLDEKNRIIVPSKYRQALQGKLIMTRGLDGCLACYPAQEFEKYIEGLSSLPMEKKDVRQYMRTVASNAEECELDKQGRVVLPQRLKEAAGIIREIVIIGAFNRFEVWSAEAFGRYEELTYPLYEKMAEGLSDMAFKQGQ